MGTEVVMQKTQTIPHQFKEEGIGVATLGAYSTIDSHDLLPQLVYEHFTSQWNSKLLSEQIYDIGRGYLMYHMPPK